VAAVDLVGLDAEPFVGVAARPGGGEHAAVGAGAHDQVGGELVQDLRLAAPRLIG
jgi:hypothetical protein